MAQRVADHRADLRPAAKFSRFGTGMIIVVVMGRNAHASAFTCVCVCDSLRACVTVIDGRGRKKLSE